MQLLYFPQLILDDSADNSFDVLLSGDCILLPSNFCPGKTYTVTFTQDSIGNRVVTYPSSWKNMTDISSVSGKTSRQQVHVHSDGTVAACSPLTIY